MNNAVGAVGGSFRRVSTRRRREGGCAFSGNAVAVRSVIDASWTGVDEGYKALQSDTKCYRVIQSDTIDWYSGYSVLLLASSLSLRRMGVDYCKPSRTSDLGRRDETVSTLGISVSSLSLLRRLITSGCGAALVDLGWPRVAPDFADLRRFSGLLSVGDNERLECVGARGE